jgi:tRNA (cytidine/uridine-2'-O-)-methyltransferase
MNYELSERSLMASLIIVLVEPRIPQNTGNIARTCAVTGAALHLVRPLGFTVTDAKLKRAGLDYWHMLDITYYDSLDDFFSRTAGVYFYLTTKGGHVYSDIAFPPDSFLLFGREDAGLPETLLAAAPARGLRIPMRGESRSLNLSNSVAIVAFEALRQWGFPDLKATSRLPGEG